MANGLFDSLNSDSESLNYFVGLSADEIIAQLRQIRLPVKIISMYAVGSRHYCWFQTSAKIKKVKGKQNGNSTEI